MDARKSIDRLRHINDPGVIPNKLIKSKNKIEVATVVNDLIRNDQLYSRFDRPLDDDKYYLALVSETGTDRIRAFLANQTTETISMKLFPMDGRRQLFEVMLKNDHKVGRNFVVYPSFNAEISHKYFNLR